MTKKDTAKILYIAKSAYPKHYESITEQEVEGLINVWHMCLEDYNYPTAQMGIKTYIASDRKGFPPSVGQLIDCIHKITDFSEEDMTELDAWGYVYNAVCNSGYHFEEEFLKLPEPVRNAVGNAARLKEWSQMDMKDVQTVIQSNFMRSFKAKQGHRKEFRTMSSDVQKLIADTAGSPYIGQKDNLKLNKDNPANKLEKAPRNDKLMDSKNDGFQKFEKFLKNLKGA